MIFGQGKICCICKGTDHAARSHRKYDGTVDAMNDFFLQYIFEIFGLAYTCLTVFYKHFLSGASASAPILLPELQLCARQPWEQRGGVWAAGDPPEDRDA